MNNGFSFPTTSCQANVAPITCEISDLMVYSSGQDPDNILRNDEPFYLSLSIKFGGSGAAALMAIDCLPITVVFYAESIGPGSEVKLAEATTTTDPGTFEYTLKTPAILAQGLLDAERVYRVSAVVRVGAEKYPALVNGWAEAVGLQIYAP